MIGQHARELGALAEHGVDEPCGNARSPVIGDGRRRAPCRARLLVLGRAHRASSASLQQLRLRRARRGWRNPASPRLPAGSAAAGARRSAWMVCTLSPPGVSIAMANRRARALHLVGVGSRRSELGEPVCAACASSSVTHCASVVEHALRHLGRGGLGVGEARMRSGGVPASSRRSTRMRQHVRLAGAGVGATQAEAAGSAASRLARVGALEVGQRACAHRNHSSALRRRRPFGDAREVGVVVVVVGASEGRAPQRLDRALPRSSKRAMSRPSPSSARGERGDVGASDGALLAAGGSPRGGDVAQARHALTASR